MRTINTNVYKFNELNDEAKKVAIEQYKEINDFHYQHVIDDAETIGAMLGFNDMSISFSGFWSQGDGASFSCGFEYKKGMTAAVKAYAPQDTALHDIAKRLQDVHKKAFYKVKGRIRNGGHYCHAYTMQIADIWHDEKGCDYDFESSGIESDILECARDFANWIYKHLENEYEYQQSDEFIFDMLIANEYEFTIDGQRI